MQTLHRNNQAGRQIWTRKFPAVRRRRQSLLHRAASQTVYMPVKKNTWNVPPHTQDWKPNAIQQSIKSKSNEKDFIIVMQKDGDNWQMTDRIKRSSWVNIF